MEATQAEPGQLHYRNYWKPVSVKELTRKEKYRAQEGLMLLTQKRSGAIKGRLAYNRQRGQKQSDCTDKKSFPHLRHQCL